MDRLRLWRYKKLANNEIVKEEKVIDDEDYNSCFQLKKNLKVREKIEILIFLHPTIKKVVEVDNADCNATKKPLSYKLEREELIINEVSTFFSIVEVNIWEIPYEKTSCSHSQLCLKSKILILSDTQRTIQCWHLRFNENP